MLFPTKIIAKELKNILLNDDFKVRYEAYSELKITNLPVMPLSPWVQSVLLWSMMKDMFKMRKLSKNEYFNKLRQRFIHKQYVYAIDGFQSAWCDFEKN